MKISRSFCLLTVAVSIIASLPGCNSAAPQVVEIPPPEVTVGKPLVQKVTDFYEYTGRIEAIDSVEIKARVSGYLTKRPFSEGEEVERGELLFEIDQRPFQASLAAAEAQLAAARAEVAETTARVNRYTEARKRGAISQDEFDTAVANKLTAEAKVDAANAEIRQAALDLEFTDIKAPIDGRIGRASADVGNLISGGLGSSPLATVVSQDPIYVQFNIDERALLEYQERARAEGRETRPDRLIELNLPIYLGLPSEDGFPHVGLLVFGDNRIDPSTGTVMCRAAFRNNSRFLTPGLFVRVRIPKGDARERVLVEDRIIGTDQATKFVLSVDENDVANYVKVETGPIIDGLRAIDDGLTGDETLIVNGAMRVRPGITVNPTSEEPPPALAADESLPDPTQELDAVRKEFLEYEGNTAELDTSETSSEEASVGEDTSDTDTNTEAPAETPPDQEAEN
ncbi:efflux RND transporter periplasmic adaptor subunit [Stratiformator vulcanicus]|uniref:efflux RND transporter periplasmic adaptor subunit n=1 Tax=Stratiformator vulcanicus TaxID=2527980 RepID=UPI0028780734|nr:efflux RND transporter periplasmic adaptor subunit [Stratiformator vulcanicus]